MLLMSIQSTSEQHFESSRSTKAFRYFQYMILKENPFVPLNVMILMGNWFVPLASEDISIAETCFVIEDLNVAKNQRDCSEKHVCEVCHKIYKLRSSLRNHQRLQCGKDPQFAYDKVFSAMLCLLALSSTFEQSQHASQERKCLYSPPHCAYRAHPKGLQLFDRVSNGDQKHVCPTCGKIYKHLSSLKSHRRVGLHPHIPMGDAGHTENTSSSCNTSIGCLSLLSASTSTILRFQKTFMIIDWMKNTFAPIATEVTPTSEVCRDTRSSSVENSLNSPARSVTTNLSIKTISNPTSLVDTIIYFHGDQVYRLKFSCSSCSRVYCHKKDMMRHSKICGKDPQQACPYCSYITRYKGNLKSHIMFRHPEKLFPNH
ncbi:hypothetical protein GE061_020268 [Apolygus lucorum]|uniref:C2H2-type domain-containing protein n=1 Tax=Apolygus lucorum TaxID=248454 RepID=A0A8S9WM44_APOLU|nr:hypothetical protein GE061_020268 [Apolygus lucorum]